MKEFLSVDEHRPPKPGRYWCVTIRRVPTGNNGIVNVIYNNQGWRVWDGQQWDGDGFTHFYAEKERVTANGI